MDGLESYDKSGFSCDPAYTSETWELRLPPETVGQMLAPLVAGAPKFGTHAWKHHLSDLASIFHHRVGWASCAFKT